MLHVDEVRNPIKNIHKTKHTNLIEAAKTIMTTDTYPKISIKNHFSLFPFYLLKLSTNSATSDVRGMTLCGFMFATKKTGELARKVPST